MKIIVGLGNPGERYKNNRHNVGQRLIDYLINELTGSRVNKFKLIKTDVFMNQSGNFVKKLIKNLIPPLAGENLVVVHDDLDIPLGKFKIQKGVGPKLHNGLESIEQALGTKDFLRIRIGVDNRKPENWLDGESYVLQDFTSEEKNIVNNIFPKIFSRLKTEFLSQHI